MAYYGRYRGYGRYGRRSSAVNRAFWRGVRSGRRRAYRRRWW